MHKLMRALTYGITLAVSATAAAQEKIDFMFPAPVDGKLTMEMTRIIKAFNDSQKEVEVRGIFTGNYDTTKMKAESAQKAGQPPALVIMSANFTTDLALKDEILPMDELFKYGDKKSGRFPAKRLLACDAEECAGDGRNLCHPVPQLDANPLLQQNAVCAGGHYATATRLENAAGGCEKADGPEQRPVGHYAPLYQ